MAEPKAKDSAGASDVVTLGDAWLGQAVRDGLVQPIKGADTYRCLCVLGVGGGRSRLVGAMQAMSAVQAGGWPGQAGAGH